MLSVDPAPNAIVTIGAPNAEVRFGNRLPLAEVAEGHRLIDTERTIGKIAIVVAGA